MQTFLALGSLIGGLGLFLLALRMMTNGLKHAGGPALRHMLAYWTSTPARGIASGLALTAVVQSSSAVTVATIGFVNAGLLTLYQSLGVVYGANIGTTMTGWLVATLGFKIKVELFALPMVGLGMLLQLTGPAQRRGAIGEALAGFGLFFIGIDVLRTAFEGLAALYDIQSLSPQGFTGVLLFLWLGFVMTLLTQSSSAAMAVILTAATGGVLTLSGAAVMVIGANVGTTSTAGFAVIGATSNAKRVAGAHIAFNLLTGAVALLLLPVMLWSVQATGHLLGLDDVPAVSLALFHTVFNVLGVLLILPFTPRLSRFLENRFRSQEELEGRPQYLDQTVAVAPVLAVEALTLEVGRIGAIARRMGKAVLSAELAPGARVARDHAALQSLMSFVGEFITRLERASMLAGVAESLTRLLRTAQYFHQAADLAVTIGAAQTSLQPQPDAAIAGAVARFKAQLAGLLDHADPLQADFVPEYLDKDLEGVQSAYQALKDDLLRAGAEQRVKIADMSETLEQLSRIRRMGEQNAKGARFLAGLLRKSAAADADEAGTESSAVIDKQPS